jgi:hypothetical protein
MRGKEKSDPNGLLYILFWEGANGGKVKQYHCLVVKQVRLFGGRTSLDIWWSNKFGALFQIQSF